jgi:DNA (cytosine-5)-methyltransferase 1
MTATYNEIDEYASRWIGNLIAADHVAPGTVDSRSIVDLTAEDVRHATQAHFFAGIAVWSAAARAAGWPDIAPIWTGSCPCQPFS